MKTVSKNKVSELNETVSLVFVVMLSFLHADNAIRQTTDIRLISLNTEGKVKPKTVC